MLVHIEYLRSASFTSASSLSQWHPLSHDSLIYTDIDILSTTAPENLPNALWCALKFLAQPHKKKTETKTNLSPNFVGFTVRTVHRELAIRITWAHHQHHAAGICVCHWQAAPPRYPNRSFSSRIFLVCIYAWPRFAASLNPNATSVISQSAML